MAEKRKLPARERREPAAKRRVSEATPQSHKKKAPTPRAPSPEVVDAPLPTKIKDVDSLPIVRTRQPISLSDKEYQSIAERFDIVTPTIRDTTDILCLNQTAQFFSRPSNDQRRNG